MIYKEIRNEKTEGIKLQHLLAKMYNKKAQIELTLLVGDVRLCEFSRWLQ
jgi:hypothetical protein